MSKFSLMAATAAVLFLVPAAHAADTKPTESSRDEQVICKRQEALTGSRMGKTKICKTKAEWDRLERAAREQVGDMNHSGNAQERAAPGG